MIDAFLPVTHDPGASLALIVLVVIVAVLVGGLLLEARADAEAERLDRLADEVAHRRPPRRVEPIPGGRVFDWRRDDPDVA